MYEEQHMQLALNKYIMRKQSNERGASSMEQQ